MSKDDEIGEDTVGYGKPPRHSRFRKGESGNPSGRPKGARGLKADLKAELSERVRVTENGRTRRLTKQQLILKSLAARAAKGDNRATAKIVDLMLTLFGVDGEESMARGISESDEALLARFLAEGRRPPEDSDA